MTIWTFLAWVCVGADMRSPPCDSATSRRYLCSHGAVSVLDMARRVGVGAGVGGVKVGSS